MSMVLRLGRRKHASAFFDGFDKVVEKVRISPCRVERERGELKGTRACSEARSCRQESKTAENRNLTKAGQGDILTFAL